MNITSTQFIFSQRTVDLDTLIEGFRQLSGGAVRALSKADHGGGNFAVHLAWDGAPNAPLSVQSIHSGGVIDSEGALIEGALDARQTVRVQHAAGDNRLSTLVQRVMQTLGGAEVVDPDVEVLRSDDPLHAQRERLRAQFRGFAVDARSMRWKMLLFLPVALLFLALGLLLALVMIPVRLGWLLLHKLKRH